MKRDFISDDQVEDEIKMLQSSPYVKLAYKERSIKTARRQYMYQLRIMEKRGKKLAEDGITMDNIAAVMGAEELEC